jgi:isocitrate/isopropylmalate dehydrogenase
MRSYRVACLTGCGTAPELMAEASRAMQAVGRLHGFGLELDYVPFGADARVRGQALSRGAYLGADAVLVADGDDEAVGELRAELDLRARQTRVRFGERSDLVLLAPVDAASSAWTVARAFALARSRRLRLTAVSDGAAWRELVQAETEANDGVRVEVLDRSTALAAAAFHAESFDVLLSDPTLGEPLSSLVGAASVPARVAATAFVAGHGPSLFAPLDTGSAEHAGFGATDPSSMLLAAAMALGDGLGERGAADTLVGALAGAKARTADRIRAGVAATTREVTESVMAGFQNAFTNAEFHPGVLAR